uniref:Slc25a-33 n=1 Tax=Schmidtea mediterranea TaxID=79327 RepID=A0A0H3YJ86_SCHMD|nr:slc25a-33 [Schmidtea mediterranea]
MTNDQKPRKWYCSNLAALTTLIITHPFDVIKVRLQMQQATEKGFISMFHEGLTKHGLKSLYTGVDANLCRFFISSVPKFGSYELYKNYNYNGEKMPRFENIVVAGCAGILGAVISNPFDVIKSRMENDIKLDSNKRRNYKNVWDGFGKSVKTEGCSCLWKGVSMKAVKTLLWTIGIIVGYEETSQKIKESEMVSNKCLITILSAVTATGIAVVLVNPFDVVKTRLMTVNSGRYKGIADCLRDIYGNGLKGFYKGFVPSLLRAIPNSIIFYIFKEIYEEKL